MNSEKLDLLKKTAIFSTLKNRELDVIEKNSEIYTFKKGDLIFNEGNRSDGIYIVKEGKVLIFKRLDEEETVDLARFIRGESFGELDFLEATPVSATALAEADSEILIFPSRDIKFEAILNKHPSVSGMILHELIAVMAGRIRNLNRLISEKSQWVEDLKNQLLKDRLTGLFNRTYLDEEFKAQLPDMGGITGFIMIKPDNFKTINDNYGHDAGDRTLKLIADTVRSLIGREGIAARYRGDEYAVIMPGSDREKTLEISEKIKDAIKGLNFEKITGGDKLVVTVSIGTALYPHNASDSAQLTGICFEKMFQAREGGGDRIVCA